MDKIYIYTDGGARGNPGHSAIGVLILDQNKNKILEYKEYIGEGTNNQAEYRAINKALELARDICKKEVECFLDSELVVKQINGEYKIRNGLLKELNHALKIKEKEFDKISYTHVRRENEYIQIADKLVNQALDQATS